MWDKAPPGYEGMNVAQVASLNPSVLTPLITPANTLLQSRQARRLYVGNVPLSAGDVCRASMAHVWRRVIFIFVKAEVMDFFNAAMVAAKIVPTGVNAVVGCQMNHEKNYAFIEFRSPEEATAAMAFDGWFILRFPSCAKFFIRDCTAEQYIESAKA
jgi:splicing factor U2AF subunit